MAFLDEKFLEELKRKCNIVDIVGRYCVLQRKGSSNYWARCPLPGHSEKTPSFTVNEPGQFYHCFGCGKGGDVIKFVQEVEALSFYEAVKFLADICKIDMPESDDFNEAEIKKNKNQRERLYAVLKDTALFYVKNLQKPEAKDYIAYVDKRGFTKETVRAFGMGASLGYNELPIYLKSLGYTEQEMLDAGVCQKNDRGNLFDSEANRLVIPIINAMSKVVGFTGRVLKPTSDKIGKYKNTKETQVFIKKKLLFGINNLKKIRTEKQIPFVIMVEGNLDVVSLYQAGFTNVVASMGTSLTLEQAKLLKRYTDVVYVCYDGDTAGQNATLRSFDIFLGEDFEIKIVPLPNGKDPDDIIREGGKDAYQKLLNSAMPLIDFKLKVLKNGKDFSDVSDRRKYVAEALNLVRTVEDEYLKEELLTQIRDASGLTYESLKRDLEKGKPTKQGQKSNEVITQKPSSLIETAERFILASFIYKKNYALSSEFDDLFFNDKVREVLAETVVFSGIDFNVSNLNELVGESGLEELNAVLNAGDNIFNKEGEEKYFNDCLITLKRYNLESEISKLNKEYSNETDLNKRKQLALILLKLTDKLAELKNGG